LQLKFFNYDIAEYDIPEYYCKQIA